MSKEAQIRLIATSLMLTLAMLNCVNESVAPTVSANTATPEHTFLATETLTPTLLPPLPTSTIEVSPTPDILTILSQQFQSEEQLDTPDGLISAPTGFYLPESGYAMKISQQPPNRPLYVSFDAVTHYKRALDYGVFGFLGDFYADSTPDLSEVGIGSIIHEQLGGYDAIGKQVVIFNGDQTHTTYFVDKVLIAKYTGGDAKVPVEYYINLATGEHLHDGNDLYNPQNLFYLAYNKASRIEHGGKHATFQVCSQSEYVMEGSLVTDLRIFYLLEEVLPLPLP